MVLVFGAAGTCGAAVVRALVRNGAKVRGFVRTATRAQTARDAGASEVVVGDLRDVASVDAALDSVRAVYYVAPRFIADEASIGRMVIQAATRAGIERLVYQSVMHSNARAMLHHEAKREVEEALYESALDFTILQTARMMHNITPAWHNIARSGTYVEPFSSDVPIADVDYDDVAEAAAIALTRDGFGKATFELCADGMLNRHQRASLLSTAMGRPVQAGSCSVDDWLTKAGIVDPYEKEARTRMFRYYDAFGFQGGNGFVLRSLLGRAPTSYAQFLEKIAQHLGAPPRN